MKQKSQAHFFPTHIANSLNLFKNELTYTFLFLKELIVFYF